jgi:D-sedoheptulose 7-phosphate isomerase
VDYIELLIRRYPILIECREGIAKAYRLMKGCFESGNKFFVAGNGGSAADSGHIVGELMKSFVKKRPLSAGFVQRLNEVSREHSEYLSKSIQCGFPAIDLSAQGPLLTACINDIGSDLIYAQQICNYGGNGDVFMGISTSGNAKNLLYGMIAAKAKGINTIALLGGSGGTVKDYADAAVVVPESETYKVQELHLPIYHALCLAIEEYFFP